MKRKLILLLSLLGCMTSGIHAQQPSDDTSDNSDYTRRMQWFADAKLGIFIHWGIYAVDGTSESWAFYPEYFILRLTCLFFAEKYFTRVIL